MLRDYLLNGSGIQAQANENAPDGDEVIALSGESVCYLDENG